MKQIQYIVLGLILLLAPIKGDQTITEKLEDKLTYAGEQIKEQAIKVKEYFEAPVSA